MKKLITILLILVSLFCKGQTFADGGLGVAPASLAGGLNVGYRVPFVECGGGGWIVSCGTLAAFDLKETILAVKAGKGFRIYYGGEIEALIGYGYKLQSQENKSLNRTGTTYTVNWLTNTGVGSWVVSGNYTKGTYFFTLGFRVYFY